MSLSPEQALGQIRDRILAASAARSTLVIHGGRSKTFMGNAVQGEPLDIQPYAGIISYEPTELVIRARAGTRLTEIAAALAERRQMLAFEPPGFGPQATLGGTIATGVSGPARASAGAARDFVLGASLLDAQGELLRFGGQVMKNVAGYDVSRLLCGSYGVLGVITEVSLKVLPVPAARRSLRIAADYEQAVQWLNQWAGEPLPISASCWFEDELYLRLWGASAAVDAAAQRFATDCQASEIPAAQADAFWRSIAEQSHSFFTGAEPLWRFSVPSIAPHLNFPGAQMIEWGGGLRWLRTDLETGLLRDAAANVGGTASRYRGGERAEVFHPLAPGMLALQRRLKRQFDPHGLFNPGRLYAAL